MKKSYSDGMGTFLNVDRCCDDDNFVTLEIEEEQADDSYINVNINLHKEDIKDLVEDLNCLIDNKKDVKLEMREYIVAVDYYPIVIDKSELFKVKTTMNKEELHDKILKQKESENEHYEVHVTVITVDEYLKNIDTLEIE